jgi:AraC-like DNA-binding protein
MIIMTEQLSMNHIHVGHSTTFDAKAYGMLHCHPVYELYYFISGTVDYAVDGIMYQPKPYSVLLLAPGVFHEYRVKSPEKYERHTLHFDPVLLPEQLRQQLLMPFHSNSIYLENADALQYEFKAFKALNALPEEILEAAMNARLVAFLSQILAMHSECIKDAGEATEMDITLPQKIISHINIYFSEKITLDMLSQRFFLSKNQINRIFTRETGWSVMEYVRNKRVAYAEQLRAQGMPAAEAAYKAGFENYSTYYRVKRRWKG